MNANNEVNAELGTMGYIYIYQFGKEEKKCGTKKGGAVNQHNKDPQKPTALCSKFFRFYGETYRNGFQNCALKE